MNPLVRRTIAEALRLARRPQGVTPPDLAEAAGCSLRAAQRNLAALAGDGILVAVVPGRKGQRRGDWRTVYRLAGEVGD